MMYDRNLRDEMARAIDECMLDQRNTRFPFILSVSKIESEILHA